MKAALLYEGVLRSHSRTSPGCCFGRTSRIYTVALLFFLEVFTEKLFGWCDCTFAVAYFKGSLTSRDRLLQGIAYFKGSLTSRDRLLQGIAYFKGSLTSRDRLLQGIVLTYNNSKCWGYYGGQRWCSLMMQHNLSTRSVLPHCDGTYMVVHLRRLTELDVKGRF